MKRSLIIILGLCLFINNIYCLNYNSALADKVDPASINYPKDVNFEIYSGYLDIWNNGSQLVHYVFLTSQQDKQNDPLLYWTNGGPGCSSLLGWVQELGPFLFSGTNTTFQNNVENSWNKKANVLFLENPPGVGYSIQNISGYKQTDPNSGLANFWALQAFYNKFPEFIGRPFWLSGESYAGMYIPYMLDNIRKNNIDPQNDTVTVNVKGFLIGNNVFVMSESMLNEYTTNTFVTHQFLSDPIVQQYYSNCFGNPSSIKCKEARSVLSNVQSNIDPYSIYTYNYGYRTPSTLDIKQNSIPIKQKNTMLFGVNSQEELKILIEDEIQKLEEGYYLKQLNEIPLTPDEVMIQYFSNATIMKALHVYDTLSQYKDMQKFTWQPCSNLVNLFYQRSNDSTQLYPEFLKAGYQILIYNGNTDAVVPFQYSRACINNLFNNYDVNVTSAQPWQTWNPLPNKQLGGWSQSWQNHNLNKGAPQNNFTFAVVRAAGHEVPEYQGVAAYHMLENFMNGKQL